MTGVLCTRIYSSDSKWLIQLSLAADEAIARYSASVVDLATMYCFLELQLIGVEPKKMTYAVVDWIACLVSVRERVELHRRLAANEKVMIQGALEIAKNALDRIPVSCCRTVHELGEFIDSKGNIRTS